LLDGVARSADQPSPEQQEEFMNTDTITDRVIAVDYGTSLPDMIAGGKYDWVNPSITADKFPIEGTGAKNFRTKLFHFSRDISSEDAIAAMKSDNFLPATHLHGLAFGAAFPDEQRKYPIVCLGSSAQVCGGRGVVGLGGGGVGRDLRLYGWGGGWRGNWRFLGVQEVSGT
jgi:hypothetical protein